MRTIILLLLAAFTCAAQEKPEAPKPNHRVFYVATSILAASSSADFLATSRLLARGGHENNSWLGSHPSNAHISSFAAAYFAGQTTAFYFTEKNPHRLIRWAGRAYIGLAIEEHARMAACNATVNVHSPHAQNCRSFLPF